MEGYQAPVEQNKTQTGSRLKIIFAILFILLLLGVLNYFKVFSVFSTFLGQLSLLPGQTVKKNIIPSPTQKKVPTGKSNFTPAVFNYDTEKAKTLLTQYMKDTIKPELLPANFDIEQGLTEEGTTGTINYQFGSFFTEQKSTIYANFVYVVNSNTQDGYGVVITPENTNQKANISTANPLLSNYFTDPYVVSDCKARGNGTICENFQKTNNGKVGYGLYKNQNLKVFVLFACLMPKEGQYYNTVTSCIRQNGL